MITIGSTGCSSAPAGISSMRRTVSKPFLDLADQRVVGGEVGVRSGHDEELAAGGAGRLVARLRHRDDSFRVDEVVRHALAHLVAGTAGADPARVPALDHVPRHDPVEGEAVVELLAGKAHERATRLRSLLGIELDGEVAAAGLDRCDVGLAASELEARRGAACAPAWAAACPPSRTSRRRLRSHRSGRSRRWRRSCHRRRLPHTRPTGRSARRRPRAAASEPVWTRARSRSLHSRAGSDAADAGSTGARAGSDAAVELARFNLPPIRPRPGGGR